jgi:hypothetical protein
LSIVKREGEADRQVREEGLKETTLNEDGSRGVQRSGGDDRTINQKREGRFCCCSDTKLSFVKRLN